MNSNVVGAVSGEPVELVHDPGWSDRLEGLVGFYRARRDVFEGSLSRHFRDLATWETPRGGLFFWLRLRRPVDTRTLLDEAIENGVAFMPGEEFSPGRADIGTKRLNFSHANPDDAERGLETLARLLAG